MENKERHYEVMESDGYYYVTDGKYLQARIGAHDGAKDDAELFVRAVNAYDTLRARVKELEDAAEQVKQTCIAKVNQNLIDGGWATTEERDRVLEIIAELEAITLEEGDNQ